MSVSASEFKEGVMDAQARLQSMEVEGESVFNEEYRRRLAREQARDAARRVALAKEKNQRMEIADAIAGGLESLPAAVADIEGANRLERVADLKTKYEKELRKQEKAEDSQTDKEFYLSDNTMEGRTISPLRLNLPETSKADYNDLRDLLDGVAKRRSDEKMNLRDQVSILDKAAPVVQQLIDGNPSLQSNPFFSGMQDIMSSLQRTITSAAENCSESVTQRTEPTEAICSAGDWARFVMKTESLGPAMILGLARGLTRPVDARDPSDWMSLFWKVAVTTPSSSIIRHNINTKVEELIAELDRASEIFAFSYRHRVHGNQTNGLRYRLQECCWAELRNVLEAAVLARPHGRVILWWDQVLNATNEKESTQMTWAAIGLLPYAVFRVVYNPPTRCEKHNPVYQGINDFETPTDSEDINRLWLNLEHRLALRGQGLLMSRRAKADGCVLWNLERTGSAWDGHLIRKIQGDECAPMLGIRRIISHLLREQVEGLATTFLPDVPKLQQWAATLAILPRKDWSSFLAGRVFCGQKLTVANVIRIVLHAGAPTTLDGGGPMMPSSPTVECPRTLENRSWSGVSEWAPLLMENALDGWMEADVEKESREELERFTIWVVFPIETDSQISEAVAIGKLWTSVQAVSSYMLVWLELPINFEC